MKKFILFLILLLPAVASAAPALTKAFCGAEGYGDDDVAFSETSGFDVCFVNTSSDTGGSPTAGVGRSHTGTLRQCLTGLTGPRAVVLMGSRNIKLTTPIAVTNTYADFVLLGQASRTQISGAGIDLDTAGYDGRMLVMYRWDDAKDGGIEFVRFRSLKNTATDLNSGNWTQKGGNLTLEQVKGFHLWHNTFSHANDDSVTSYGASSGKRYNQDVLFQANLFSHTITNKVFSKHLIIFPTSSATYPSGSDTCGHTLYKNAFVGHARTPEYKCKNIEIVNNVILGGGGFNYAPIHLKGDNYPDVRYNLFLGANSTQYGRPVDISYNFGGGTPTYEGFHAIGTVPDYLVEGNWKENGTQWTTTAAVNFKSGNTLVQPQPTAKASRSPIGEITEGNIIKSNAIALRDAVINNAGVYQHYNCDGTVNSFRDKLDRLAAKELKEGRMYQRQGEDQDGGEETMSGIGSCTDTDGDGMFDAYETRFGFSNSTDDALSDADSDGIPNFWEYFYGMDPTTSDASGC